MRSTEEQAKAGLLQIEEAIEGLLEQHSEGLTNAQIARQLGIETGEPGEHRNMLSWSIIGRLIRTGRVERVEAGRSVVFRTAKR